MTPPLLPVAIYARVSKKDGSQSTARQVSALQELARSKGWQVVEVISEQEKGSKKRRAGTQRLALLAQEGKIKKVLIEEPKRLGRNLLDSLQTLEDLHQEGVSLYSRQDGQETLGPGGKKTPYGLMIYPFLSGVAEGDNQERGENIRQGLAQARRRGVVLGRPKGSFNQLLQRRIQSHLAEGRLSIRQIARLEQCSPSTVQAVKKRLASTNPALA